MIQVIWYYQSTLIMCAKMREVESDLQGMSDGRVY